MTREEAKELLPIIQAFAKGKTIECKNLFGSWAEAKCPSWSNNFEYRIKPEPKYRPFKSQEECWNEMMKHQPFGWIRSINNQCLRNIDSIGHTTRGIGINNSVMYFNTAFNEYKFIDGTPFGIKEQEIKL